LAPWGFGVIGVATTFFAMTRSGGIETEQVANHLFLWMMLMAGGTVLSWIGLILIAVALFRFRFRPRWLFWVLIGIGLLSCVAYRFGPLFGLPLLLAVLLSRRTFSSRSPEPPEVGA
jgi:FtsH-binding integral membrane protein